MNKKLMNNVKIIGVSLLILLLIFIFTMVTSYDFYQLSLYFALGITVIAIVFSGALLSGDRTRANNYSDKESRETSMKYSSVMMISSIPFYVVALIDYLIK